MDINAATLRSLYTAVSTAFNQRFSAVPSYYSTIAMTVTSTTAMNEYPRMDDLPGFREWIGDRVVHDLSAQNYIIRNREFEKTIGIKRSQVEDDQIGFLSTAAEQLGQDAKEFPDHLIWPLFERGDTVLCYDGQNFFDTDHPGWDENGQEVSVSNYQAGATAAWYLIDDTKVIKPMIWQSRKRFDKLIRMDSETDENVFRRGKYEYGVDGRANAGFGLWQLAYKSKAALTPENYQLAREALGGIRRRDGAKLAIKGTKLLVPQSLEGSALKITNADLVDGGNSNVWRGTAQTVVVPYLG